jgi:hypothetical protein
MNATFNGTPFIDLFEKLPEINKKLIGKIGKYSNNMVQIAVTN